MDQLESYGFCQLEDPLEFQSAEPLLQVAEAEVGLCLDHLDHHHDYIDRCLVIDMKSAHRSYGTVETHADHHHLGARARDWHTSCVRYPSVVAALLLALTPLVRGAFAHLSPAEL
jgi:hypothetical protein